MTLKDKTKIEKKNKCYFCGSEEEKRCSFNNFEHRIFKLIPKNSNACLECYIVACLKNSKVSYPKGWISVEDRLPKEAGFYLAVGNVFPVEKTEFDGISRWNYKFGIVDYWMPLPYSPKET